MGDHDDGGRGGATESAGTGLLWTAGWLFTLGYLGLPLGKALLAILLWPWYLGAALG